MPFSNKQELITTSNAYAELTRKHNTNLHILIRIRILVLILILILILILVLNLQKPSEPIRNHKKP